MAQVNVLIHGKSYAIACDDGQERRLQELGRLVDSRVRDIAASGAGKTDSHLLVLASLVMADEIWELRESINSLNQRVRDQAAEIAAVPTEDATLSAEEEKEILAAIDHLSARIDSVADRLAKM